MANRFRECLSHCPECQPSESTRLRNVQDPACVGGVECPNCQRWWSSLPTTGSYPQRPHDKRRLQIIAD